ncbi:PREDICTED: GATA transcription factor 3 [Tarenaya hassleriana]|uniref:GATA transcription factor 3 n=1 Tax=Tarenaya hassleriana TaxID=28532 RepID=UPI00053C5620|nr:PREDICTED: GATA transcription factor 3 [Tarenaya hassleriana]
MMEKWTEARALKPSLIRGEPTTAKPPQSAVSDELLSRVSSVEDFSVECFLDLSEEEDDLLVHEGVDDDDDDDDDEGQELVSLCSSQEEQAESEPFLLDQWPIPEEDMAELEWVSRVMDDDYSSLIFTERKPQEAGRRWDHHSRKPCFSFRVPVKPRSKRSRNGKTRQPIWPFLKPRPTKQPESMFQRRCSHCGANSTPQWRTGPLGPKTLCNACGVRYKSGRLCREYRPACSPTFSSGIHSNVHRKVLELRKMNESSANQTESNSAGGGATLR